MPALLKVGVALTVMAIVGGCFRPRRGDCLLRCSASSDCPGQMSCDSGLCTAGATCVPTVAAGETHSCAVLGPSLKCWGKNHAGQLGQGDREARGDGAGEMGGDLPPVALGAGRYVPAKAADGTSPLALGSGHTCVVLDDGKVKCWGDNSLGQLGLGDLRARVDRSELGDALPAVDLGRGRRVRSLAAGLYHTCALLEDRDIKCWGDNRFGQLGLGASGNRGGLPGEMGDNLASVNLGPVASAWLLAAGAYHTCAGLVDGAVKCWGWNEYGQLGLGDGRPRGLSASEMGAALAAVPLGKGRRVAGIAAGAYHTCALLDGQGDLKCWGYNGAGQLGRGSLSSKTPILTQSMGRAPFAAEDLVAVDLGPGRRATAITAGASHGCALLDDHSVRCWGLNMSGQLGIGTTDNRGDQANEMGERLPAVALEGGGGLALAVSAGADHTCAVRGLSVTCWGLNLYGRLGVGDTMARGDGHAPPAPVDLGTAPTP